MFLDLGQIALEPSGLSEKNAPGYRNRGPARK